MSTQDNDSVPVDSLLDQPADEAPPQRELGEMTTDLEDRLRRAIAEADNVRKRCARQVADERLAERARVATEWLPVVDNLERALEHAGDGDPVVDGVRAVRDQAVAVLAGLGFPRHAETGVPFDPYRHEAVGVIGNSQAAPGEVAQVVRPGYGDGPALLRPAAVLVAADRG
jgi:molecular chaperone GrpE